MLIIKHRVYYLLEKHIHYLMLIDIINIFYNNISYL